MKRILIVLIVFISVIGKLKSQEIGDTVSVGNTEYKVQSINLISNPGFEDGFTGWTDATSSALTLSSSYFSINTTGGIDDSQYLIGTTNASSSSAGSIGTGWSIESGKTYYFSYHVKYQDATATANTEDWLKVSLTNDKTNSAEPFVLMNGASVDGGGVWTKNSVAFTNTNPYNYIVARFRWLGNRLGFDAFELYEVQEIPDTAQLNATIQEAQELYDPLAEGAQDLDNAITIAENLLTSTSSDDVKQGILDLKEAMYQFNLANASLDNPVDMSGVIINASFENGFDGWSNTGFASQTNSVFLYKAGSIYIEKWVNIGSKVPDVAVEQILTDLPNGKYTLKVAAGNIQQSGSGSTDNAGDPQTGAYLYAGLEKVNVNTMQEYSVDVIVVDNQLSIGFKTENATGNWLTCDNFRLEYKGFEIETIKTYLQTQVDIAETLLGGKLQNDVRSVLEGDVTLANQKLVAETITEEELAQAIDQIQNSIADATVSNNAYNSIQEVIDTATELYGAGDGNEAVTLQNAIDTATDISNDFSVSLDDIYNGAEDLNKAILAYHLANATGTVPTVVTNPNFARGSTMFFGRSTVSGVSVVGLLEYGFCWSTNPEPTILDNTSSKYLTNNGRIHKIDNLQPSTVYYMRAYALTKSYAVGYGDVLKVITLPKGTVSYTLASNVTGDMRDRLDDAMSSAVGYYNNLTSIKGHSLTVNYGSGTPTAEASYGGWMRFGPNTAYQKTGTALHEMGHTIGVGTHSMWYGPSSPLRETGSRGAWYGERTTQLMKFIDNDESAYLRGDAIHMWPYGINGAQEDNGTDLLYIANALIVQALGEDGLPPTGGFATPAYTFEQEEGAHYYIKSEAEQTGRDNKFLMLASNGNLINKEMTAAEALANDSAAWTIDFNPVNSYYTIKNVATGRFIYYKSTGYNGFSTVDRTMPLSYNYFQLMRGRKETNIGSMTKKGYWIIHPEAKLSPSTLLATTSDLISTVGFNIADAAITQRWLLLTEEDVNALNQATPVIDIENDLNNGVVVYSQNGNLCISNISDESDILVYNISGDLVYQTKTTSSTLKQTLSKGLYIVRVKSNKSQLVSKVVVE